MIHVEELLMLIVREHWFKIFKQETLVEFVLEACNLSHLQFY